MAGCQGQRKPCKLGLKWFSGYREMTCGQTDGLAGPQFVFHLHARQYAKAGKNEQKKAK